MVRERDNRGNVVVYDSVLEKVFVGFRVGRGGYVQGKRQRRVGGKEKVFSVLYQAGRFTLLILVRPCHSKLG